METLYFHEHEEQITPHTINRITVVVSLDGGDYRCQIVVAYKDTTLTPPIYRTLEIESWYATSAKEAYRGANQSMRYRRNHTLV